MSYRSYTAVVDTGQVDEAPQTFGGAQPMRYLPPLRNLAANAENDALLGPQLRDLCDIIRRTKDERKGLEDEWKHIDNMRRLAHDDQSGYLGRSQKYIPAYLRTHQTLVTGLSRGLFPSKDYMTVDDLSGASRAQSDVAAVASYIRWEFETNARVPRVMKKALGNYVDYGLMVLKHRYQKDLKKARGGKSRPSQAEFMSMLGMGMSPEAAQAPQPLFQERVCDGFHVSPRSPYSFYVYPWNVDTLDEAQAAFEDITVSRPYVEMMGRKGRWVNTDRIAHGSRESGRVEAEDQLAGESGMTGGDMLPGNSLGEQFHITEVWCYLRLPPDQYMPFEDKNEPIPAQVILAGEVPLLIQRNPLFSQKPPYEVSVWNAQPGHFYGFGAGRVVLNLQHLVNDYFNQSNDVGMYGLNPIIKANPALLAAPLSAIKPGVVWWVTDPTAVTFDRPPIEQVQHGVSATQMILSMLMDFGGAPPILQGTNSKGSGKTATGAQILQKNALMPLQDNVEDISRDVMEPLMQACFMYALQFRDKEVMAYVAGKPVAVRPQDFLIEPAFSWNAANQAINQQMRAQQAMQLLQILLNPGVLRLLQVAGKMPNIEVLIRRIYTDGFGFRDYDALIAQMPPQMQQMLAMQQQQAQQPGASAPAGGAEAPRSFTEQAGGGGGGELVPGEAEDGMEVRQGADDISALLGAMNGGGF